MHVARSLLSAPAMRTTLLLVLAFLSISAACTDNPRDAASPELTLRDRLEADDTRLFVTSDRSAGSIRAERLVGHAWETGLVDLHLTTGELVVRAAGGALAIEHFALSLAPIDIPATITGHFAQLVDVRAELRRPVLTPITWSTDDTSATATAKLELELGWAIAVDGTRIDLGAPTLPPLPFELRIDGTADRPHAELRLRASGEVWSWASVVRLLNLFLLVGVDGSPLDA